MCLENGLAFRLSYRDRRDVGQVGCNAWCVDHIVEGKLVNEGGRFAQQRERLKVAVSFWHGHEVLSQAHLANTTRGSAHDWRDVRKMEWLLIKLSYPL
jgi:hypothetical protein